MTLIAALDQKNPRFFLFSCALISFSELFSSITWKSEPMGAELLRHQGSVAYCHNNHSRSLWGLLDFLDFDRHRHKRKTNEKHGEVTKISTLVQNNISNDRECLLNKEENFQMENKTVAKKSSGSAHLIRLLYNKLMKKKDRKLKNSSSAARLLRTISIHYLECDDYVLQDEMTSDSDSLTVEQNSQETDSSASSKQGSKNSVLDSDGRKLGPNIPIPSGEKNLPSVPHSTEKSLQDLDNGKKVLSHSADLEQKIKSIIKEEHRISMDSVLDKIPFGHKLSDDDVEKEKVSHGGDSPRSKFGSEGFISTNSKLAHRSIQRSRSLTESLERYSSLFESEPQRIPQRSNSVKEQDKNSAHRRFLRSRSLSESLDRYSQLLEFISVREPQRLHQRSNSVKEQEHKFAHGRVLRSHSLSESFDRYHLLESISVKEPKKLHQRSNSVKEQDNSFVHGRVLRSRSLSESFDKYHLLESIAVKESQRLTQRSNSIKEQDSSFVHKRVVRSRSLSESFDRYPNLLEPFPVREPKRQPERLKSVREEESLLDMKSQISSELFNPDKMSFYFSNDVPTEVSALLLKKPDSSLLSDDAEVDACSSDEPNSAGDLVKTEESMKTDTFVQHDAEINSSLEQPEFTNEPDQSKASTVSDDQNADDGSSITENEVETETNKDSNDEPQKPSPLSLLDAYLDEDAISPAKYAESQEGPELQSDWIHSEEQDSVVNPESRLVDDDPRTTQVELNRADPDKERMATDASDINCFHVEEAEFNFVRDVLKKSGFGAGAEEFLAAWYSSYDPVDQLLFIEDPETMTDDSSDIRIDQQLLFDLINEVLLEIYESSVANSIGLSRFNPRVRPVPVGGYLLEEVWAKVSWHRSSQQDTNHTIEHVEARDYAKNDGWMNLQWNVERVGNYLEGLIFDGLVDEVIFDIVDV